MAMAMAATGQVVGRWGGGVAGETGIATRPPNKKRIKSDENAGKTARPNRQAKTRRGEMAGWDWSGMPGLADLSPRGAGCRDHPRRASASFDLVPAPLELRM